MSEKIESTSPERPKTAKEEREQRLAAQLRANLGRRKAQSRGRIETDDGESDETPRDRT